MKGEQKEREKVAIDEGCKNWSPGMGVCLKPVCYCLQVARANLRKQMSDKGDSGDD